MRFAMLCKNSFNSINSDFVVHHVFFSCVLKNRASEL